jgi:peptidyl-prolyl cis-trans isomerase C
MIRPLLEGTFMRTLRLTLAVAALAALSSAAPAQTAPNPQPTPPEATPAAAPDPVVAKVGTTEVHLSDISEAAATLPEQYRSMPAPMLFPMLLDQVVDRKALVALAQRQGLDKDARVQRQLALAADMALQNALLSRTIGPTLSDAALHARYDHDIAGKPGEEEVHARHILVATEDEAKKIITELKAGGDFAALAKAHSTDPGAAQGGDLGFFKKGDMLPEFAEAAFALQPGQIADAPVHTRYGWHVIKVEERRTAPVPTFEQSQEELRQQIIHEGVQKVIQEALAGVTVVKFNADGSVPKPDATPTPPAGPAAATPPGDATPPAAAAPPPPPATSPGDAAPTKP